MIKTYQQFNEEFTNKYKCSVCGSPMYRTDAGGHDATLQCSSDRAKFWNFTRGSKEQDEAHDHFEKSTIYVTNKEWSVISESKKKKRIKIRRMADDNVASNSPVPPVNLPADGVYDWQPVSPSESPAPQTNLPTISKIKI
jgi:hypothetical protein